MIEPPQYSSVKSNVLKKVKLGQTFGRYGGWFGKFIGKIVLKYNLRFRYWKKLRKSLEEGYNPEKYGYIQVLEKENKNSRTSTEGKILNVLDTAGAVLSLDTEERSYYVVDGNHRIKILKELYGDDYEITVEVVINNPEDGAINAGDGPIKTLRKGIKTIPIIYYPSIIFFLIYLLVPVLLFSLFCYVFMMFTKNHQQKYYTDTHPKKGFVWLYNKSKFLYEIVMTVYYNARNGVLLVAFLVYLYHILSVNFYGILIMAGISFLIMIIFRILNIPNTIHLLDLIKKIKRL